MINKDGGCTCGRTIVPQHCANCGSTNIYGRAKHNRAIREADGSMTVVRAFRCRRCTEEFDELTPCEAPRFKYKSIAEKREAEQTNDLVAKVYGGNQEERLKGIAEALKLVPPKSEGE